MSKEEKQCKHKWIPNGITSKEVWDWSVGDGNHKIGETIYASSVCEKCGEIKIKKL